MGGLSGFFKKAAPYAAGALGGIVSSAVPALRPFSAAISAGAGALANSDNRLGGALQGFAGGGIGSALKSGLQGMSAGTGFGGGAWEGLKGYGGSIPGFGGLGTSNPTGVFSKFFTPQTAGTSKLPGIAGGTGLSFTNQSPASYGAGVPFRAPTSTFTTSGAGGTPTGSTAKSGIQFKDMFSKFVPKGGTMDSVLPGLGTMMAGNLLAPKVATPDFNTPDVQRLRDMSTQEADPQVTAYYRNMLQPANSSVDSTPGLAVDKRAHDKQLADTLRSFDQQWQAAMGGQDPSNNSEYQKQRMKIMSDAEASWTANQSQFQFQYDQLKQQQQLQAATALSSLATEQRNLILQLAQLDINSIMYQTGLDAAEAASFKDMFSAAGQAMMTNAINQNDPLRQAQLQYYTQALNKAGA